MKAEELLIHIGQAKTGTTALQETLWRSSNSLLEQGVYFPRVAGRLRGSAMLLGYHLFNDQADDPIRREFLGMDKAKAQIEARRTWYMILNEVARSEMPKLLLSSEHFFVPHSANTLAQLNTETQAIAAHSQIIAYLRSPPAYELSWIQQNLKKVRTWTPGARDYIRRIVEPLMHHWHGTLSLNVFDSYDMPEGGIVPDFMGKYCPEINLSTLERTVERINTSMSAEAMAILQDLRTGRLGWEKDPMALILEVRRLDQRISEPTRPKLNEVIKCAFVNWRAPDLFWLRDTHGITFNDINYDDVDINKGDEQLIAFNAIEDICAVNKGRKEELLNCAKTRAALPAFLRRLLAKY